MKKLSLRRELLGELGADELRSVAGGTTTAGVALEGVLTTNDKICELLRHTQDTHQCTSYVR